MSYDAISRYQLSPGAFIGLTVTEKGEHILIPDLLGLRPLYFTDTFVSDRFLPLVDSLKTKQNLVFRNDSVAHFLKFGYSEPGYSLIEGIFRIKPGEGIIIKDGKFERVKINPPDLRLLFGNLTKNENASEIIKKIQARLAEILKSIDVPASADLTGGNDSRVLVSMISPESTILEASYSHNSKTNGEATTGKKVAELTGIKYYFTSAPENVSLNDLYSAFEYIDGCGNIISAFRHRKMQEERAERGIKLSISGNGGTFYKDSWWLQDFPFYKKKKASLKKLIELRICPSSITESLFSKNILNSAETITTRHSQRLGALSKGLKNTEAYDQIYYFEKSSSVLAPFIHGSLI
ncbi:MAG: hypothetical protein ACOCUL_04505, partial [Bacteroidota bacterium]